MRVQWFEDICLMSYHSGWNTEGNIVTCNPRDAEGDDDSTKKSKIQ